MAQVNHGGEHTIRPCMVDVIRAYVDALGLDQEGELLPSQCHLYKQVMHATEGILIEQVLAMVKQNQTVAAKILGISRTTLRNKLTELHAQCSD
jgi:DNA-binding protein Fis